MLTPLSHSSISPLHLIFHLAHQFLCQQAGPAFGPAGGGVAQVVVVGEGLAHCAFGALHDALGEG